VTDPAAEAPAEAPVEQIPMTKDQSTVLVGNHLLVALEEIIKAHEAALLDETKTEVQKDDARLVISAARAYGGPLFHVVKAAARPRILRPERSLHIAR
jgi:hypothetical protein